MDLQQNNNTDPRFDDHYYRNQRRSKLNWKSKDVRKLVFHQLSSSIVCLGSFYIFSSYFEVNFYLSLVISLGCSLVIITKTTSMITSVIDKIESHINYTNEDKIQDFQLRENDLFKNLEPPLNDMNKRISNLKDSNRDRNFKVINGGKRAA